MIDFCPCLTKQPAQEQILVILDNKITLMLLIACDTPSPLRLISRLGAVECTLSELQTREPLYWHMKHGTWKSFALRGFHHLCIEIRWNMLLVFPKHTRMWRQRFILILRPVSIHKFNMWLKLKFNCLLCGIWATTPQCCYPEVFLNSTSNENSSSRAPFKWLKSNTVPLIMWYLTSSCQTSSSV